MHPLIQWGPLIFYLLIQTFGIIGAVITDINDNNSFADWLWTFLWIGLFATLLWWLCAKGSTGIAWLLIFLSFIFGVVAALLASPYGRATCTF